MLAKRFGRTDMVKIWWDKKKLDGGMLFDKAIKEGINNSAVLICLYSKGYTESVYCKQELDMFYKKAHEEKTGLVVGDRPRIINVLLNNIHYNKWLPELSGTTGIKFHDAVEEEDFGDTIDILSPGFIEQLKLVRDAVWNLLNEFSEQQTVIQENEESIKTADESTFTIYLGEVADTLRISRKRTINELEKKGYNVVAGIPPPLEVGAHEKAATGSIKKADLAVHLLDEYPGREIEGAPELYYPQKQTELSLELAKNQMIWLPSETNFENIEDEKYKLFLHDLESGKSNTKGFEFIRGSKSTLAKQIIDFAEHLKEQKTKKQVEQEKISVLLDTHFNDQLYALDLSRILIENKIQPFINPQEDDPRKNINLLGDRMSQVRKLIFLYGSVSKEWIMERMSAALHLVITKNYLIDDFFIYMAPPHKDASSVSLNQHLLNINVVDSSDSQTLSKETLNKFLSSLKAEAV